MKEGLDTKIEDLVIWVLVDDNFKDAKKKVKEKIELGEKLGLNIKIKNIKDCKDVMVISCEAKYNHVSVLLQEPCLVEEKEMFKALHKKEDLWKFMEI